MHEKKALKKAGDILTSSILVENKALIKILLAINSGEEEKMVKDDIKTLTQLETEQFEESINILSKAHYIHSIGIHDIEGRSEHEMFTLTPEGKRILSVLKIER